MVTAVLAQPDPNEILRPSKAVRWSNCTGSHALERLYPEDEDTPEAREGTAGHYYVTEALYRRVWPAGSLAPNGHPITDEMVECGELYLDDVRGALAQDPDQVEYYVEAKVYGHKTIHPKNEGTPDTFAIWRAARYMIIWDYKYGHRYVDPFRNEQLTNYFGCILETLGITREEALEWTVSLRVVQPRNFHRDGPVRRWDTTGRILVGLVDDLAAAAANAKKLNPVTKTGPWCRDCSARRGCDAFLRARANAMDVASNTRTHDLPPAALGLELRNLHRAQAILKAAIDALEEQAIGVINDRKTVPYWAKGYVQGNERWKIPAADVFALGDAFEIDLRKPPAAITPAQARKAGLDPALCAEISEKPTGAAKLVPSDETAAARAFGK